MHDYAHPEVLVSTSWVAEHRDDPDVVLVEVDLESRSYRAGHIPGALSWNWTTQLCDQTVREILPKAELELLLSRSGIDPSTRVVLYGDHHNWFAAWAFWQLRMFGHRALHLMNGGREKWIAEGRELTRKTTRRAAKIYRAKSPDLSQRAYLADVRRASESGFSVLVDVRSREEYTGEWLAPPGFRETSQRGGHIPNAKSIPWNAACETDGTFKSYEALRELYESNGVDGHLPVITYCRIGERSSHTWFVLKYLLGYDSVRNYDGSWTEWGNLVGAAVERGEPNAPASVA